MQKDLDVLTQLTLKTKAVPDEDDDSRYDVEDNKAEDAEYHDECGGSEVSLGKLFIETRVERGLYHMLYSWTVMALE